MLKAWQQPGNTRGKMLTSTRPQGGIAALRRFVRSQPVERCEFCAAPIAQNHGHVVESDSRRLLCACAACACSVGEQPSGRYRRVPTHVEALTDFRMTDAEWHALGLPIEMAWLFHSTHAGRPIAFYPSPLGATQCLLGLEAWEAIVTRNPNLAEFEPDVEALLVNRINRRRNYYRVPIDRCYELVGLIRTHWQGWSGGDEVWHAIDDYFARLAPTKERAA